MHYQECKIYKKRGYNFIELDLDKYKSTQIEKRLPYLLLAQSFWIGYCLGQLNKELSDLPLLSQWPNFLIFKQLKVEWLKYFQKKFSSV